jgi:hypothetical protein
MKKTNKSVNNSVKIVDWMSSKPYSIHSEYDVYYVELCNKVHYILSNYRESCFLKNIDKAHLVKLSCMIVSYYEDFINELDMWHTFVTYNKENTGKYLPFYDLKDYDPDYLNVQDIQYLIWHSSCKIMEFEDDDKTFFFPVVDEFSLKASQLIYKLLENDIDNGLVHPFYDKLLTINSNTHFYDLKNLVLPFIALKSYFMGFEMSNEVESLVHTFSNNKKAQQNPESLEFAEKLIYSFKDTIFFEKSSSWGGISVIHLFSKIAKCDEKKRLEILELSKPHSGNFHYVSHDKKELIIKHEITNVEYNLLIKDLQPNFVKSFKKFEVGCLKLVKWNNQWIMSGIATFNQDDALKSFYPPIHSWMLDEKSLSEKNKIINDMYNDFIKIFGEPVFFAKSKEEVLDKIKKWKSISNSENDNINLELKESNDYTIFLNKNGRLLIYNDFQQNFLSQLNKNELSQKEKTHLLFCASSYYNPHLIKHILSKPHNPLTWHFPSQNISSVEENLPYLWRIFQPETQSDDNNWVEIA